MSVRGNPNFAEMTSLSSKKLADIWDGSGKDSEDGSEAVLTTVSEAIDHIGFKKFQVLLLAYVGLVWTVDAMEIMIVSFLGPALTCEFGLTPSQESMIASVVFFGIMLGAWAWGPVSDGFGRRWGFAITASGSFLLGLGSAFAPSFTVLLIIRLVFGFTLGGIPIILTLYMEFVPSKVRGVALTAAQAFWTVGTVAETLLIWAVLPTLGWRWMIGLSAVPLALVTLLFYLVPESPHWLVSKGRYAEAEAIIHRVARVSGVNLPKLDFAAGADVVQDPELQQLTGSKALEPSSEPEVVQHAAPTVGKGFLKQLSEIVRPPLLRITLLSMLIWFANTVIYYGLVMLLTTIATTEGGTSELQCTEDKKPILAASSFTQVLIVSTAELPGLVLAAVVVDLIGRKVSLVTAYIGIAIAVLLLLAPLAEIFQTVLLWISRGLGMCSFTILWIYTPEMFPTYIRSSCVGICNGFSRIGGIVAPYIGVALAHSSIAVSEIIFGALALLAAVLTLFLPRETKGAALEQS